MLIQFIILNSHIFPIGKLFVTFIQFDITFHTICPFQLGPNSGLHIIIFDEIDAICKARGSVVSIIIATGGG